MLVDRLDFTEAVSACRTSFAEGVHMKGWARSVSRCFDLKGLPPGISGPYTNWLHANGTSHVDVVETVVDASDHDETMP